MKIRLLTSCLILLPCSVPAAALPAAAETSANKPNVIVVFTDDHGYADLSCVGTEKDVKTPHLDRMAAEGVRFTDGYVTAPQCCPSRAGILTGRDQNRFGLNANKMGGLPLSELTIADRLGRAGYVTGMVGKWHLDLTENNDKKNTTRTHAGSRKHSAVTSIVTPRLMI